MVKKEQSGLRLGKHVIVIGAGNTAMDAARVARRVKGVETVSVVYRRTKRYMPADEEELMLATEDGIEFKELLAPKCQKDGILICNKVILGEPDASGRQKPVITEEEVEIPADTIIASLGDTVDTEYYEELGLDTDEKGLPLINAATMESSKKGVYLIGDGAKGPATVVMAIKDAKNAVGHFRKLSEEEVITEETDITRAALKKGILIHSDGPEKEAERCLECNYICENCVDVCPNRANVSVQIPGTSRPAVVHVDYMCNECGNCNSFCPYDSAPYKEKFTLFATAEDFEDSKNEGFVILDKESMKVKIRMDGSVAEETLTDRDCSLYAGLKDLILSIKNNYSYLLPSVGSGRP